MICLHVTDLFYPDTASRKLLMPKYPVYMEERGEESAGWYSVHAAISWYVITQGATVRRDLENLVVVGEGETLAAVVSTKKGTLLALFVGHFSAPDDYDNHFVETPLLTAPLPGAEED